MLVALRALIGQVARRANRSPDLSWRRGGLGCRTMNPGPGLPGKARFPPTHWSVVLAAGSPDMSAGLAALGQICDAYWHPLYAFARKLGYRPDDAQDLTQGFFENLIERPFLGRADAAKGRFRSFLLGAFKLHLAKVRERAGAQKRGGNCPHVSLDIARVEAQVTRELATNNTPDRLYERAWAMALLEEALNRLRREFERNGRGEAFRCFEPCLQGDPDATRRAEMAGGLGLSVGSVQVALSRARHRYAELLREVVLQTVASPAEVSDEIHHLQTVLRG
jgi:DNA-directed RNA polymerase specialized sigma24 family protein